MSLTDRSLASQAFKLSQRRAHTATNRNFYNESEESSYVVYAKDIWANIVDPDPTQAGDTVALVKLRMRSIFAAGETNANSYSAVFYWDEQSNDTKTKLTGKINPRTGILFSSTTGETAGNGNGIRVGHIVPSIINKQPVDVNGYNPILKSRTGAIVGPGDASDWYLDTFAGIVTHEIDSSGDFMLLNGTGSTYDEEGTLECYIYIGAFLTDVIGISGGSVPVDVTDAIALLQAQVGALDAEVFSISGNVGGLEIRVSALESSATSMSGSIGTLQTQYNTLSSNVYNLSGALQNYANLGQNNTFLGAHNIFTGDVTVQGTFTAAGSAYFVDAQNVSVTGAFITLNNGEVGSGVTQGEAGILIDRGPLDLPYRIVFDENSDELKIGLSGSENIVATRTTDPVQQGVLVIGDADGKNFKQDSSIAWDGETLNIDGGLTLTFSGSGANDVVTRSEIESMIQDLGGGDVTQAQLDALSGAFDIKLIDLENQISTIVSASGNVLGPAEDGDYTDGLFTDFTNITPVGHAIDRFNEILKALAPQPPAVFSEISCNRTGVAGRLSFGGSNNIAGYTNYTIANGASSDKDWNASVTLTTTNKGIISKTGNITGVLNDQVSANSSWGNNENVFADGDKGQLELWINGTEKVTVRLDLTNEALSGDQRDVNGTGFYELLAATAVTFGGSGGTVPLNSIKYRKANWQVNFADFRNGLNTIKVIHRIGVTVRQSSTYEVVVDANTNTVVYSAESLGAFSGGTTKTISGVTYHTSGTINYNVTIDGAYVNSYVDASRKITLSGTNVSQSDILVPIITTDETQNIQISNQSVGISLGGSNRLLGQSVTIRATAPRTVQTEIASTGVTSTNTYLMDAVTANSTNLIENFNDEKFRMNVVSDLSNTSYNSGGDVGGSPYVWNSATSLATYSDGLLVYNGRLTYPSRTNYNGSGVTNGNFATANLLPAGNPNYNLLANTGNKVYIRYFYVGDNIQDFRMKITTDGSTSFVPLTTTPLGGNQMHVEILAPNTTRNISNVVEWKDAYQDYINEASKGIYLQNRSSGSYRGYTLGEKSTATSGKVIVVRLTVSQDWNDRVAQIEVQPLTT
jgi:hypothetical protein